MIVINVCIGSACHLKGSYNVINSLQQLTEEYGLSDKVDTRAAFCLGRCSQSVSVRVGDGEVQSVSGATTRDFFVNQVLPVLDKNS
jgi:NADH:ubiquinone oxidoreductase subunit E